MPVSTPSHQPDRFPPGLLQVVGNGHTCSGHSMPVLQVALRIDVDYTVNWIPDLSHHPYIWVTLLGEYSTLLSASIVRSWVLQSLPTVTPEYSGVSRTLIQLEVRTPNGTFCNMWVSSGDSRKKLEMPRSIPTYISKFIRWLNSEPLAALEWFRWCHSQLYCSSHGHDWNLKRQKYSGWSIQVIVLEYILYYCTPHSYYYYMSTPGIPWQSGLRELNLSLP